MKSMALQMLTGKHEVVTDHNENNIFQKTHFFDIANIDYAFEYNQLIPFEDYEKKLTCEQLKQVIDELDLTASVFGYRSSDDLDLYVFDVSEEVFSILAVGEIQPSLYKVFVEATYKVSS